MSSRGDGHASQVPTGPISAEEFIPVWHNQTPTLLRADLKWEIQSDCAGAA